MGWFLINIYKWRRESVVMRYYWDFVFKKRRQKPLGLLLMLSVTYSATMRIAYINSSGRISVEN
jgi:hypothetical protein